MYARIKDRVHQIVQKAESGDIASMVFDVFIVSLVFLNVLAVILGSVPEIASEYEGMLDGFELFSVIIFTVEYALRVWSCTSNVTFAKPVVGRIRFALTPMALVDLAAILPFYLPSVVIDLRFLRVLRMMRMFRLFKVVRYSRALRTIAAVVQSKKEELVMTLSVVVILLVLASSLMYYVERDAQPEAFCSIPAAMWWAVATLTTVGYGDVYPITPVGKTLGMAIAILGIGMFALPAGILGSGFVEELQKRRAGPLTCPHCGREIGS